MKTNKKQLIESMVKNILKEYTPEEYPEQMSDFMQPQMKQISLDQAVDRYLVSYERESIPTSQVYEEIDVEFPKILLEQAADDEEDPADEDEGGGDEDPAGAADEEGEDDTGGDDFGLGDDEDTGGAEEDAGEGDNGGGMEEPVMNKPQIDLQGFAMSVARLVSNFESLLDPRTIILNRAEAYVQNNYDERTAQEFMMILRDHYDLEPVETSESATSEEEWPTPISVGAAGEPGGGA